MWLSFNCHGRKSGLTRGFGADQLLRSWTGISLPFLSLAFVTLNTERTEQATIKIVELTRWRPGQILLPTPNANESTGSSRTLPSSLIKRSGLNSSGSGYVSGSCKIALKHLRYGFRCIDNRRTMHSRPPKTLLHQVINDNVTKALAECTIKRRLYLLV